MRIIFCLLLMSVLSRFAAASPEPRLPSNKLTAALTTLDAQLQEAMTRQAYDKQIKLARQAYELTKKELGDEALQTQQRELTLSQALGSSGDHPAALKVQQHLLSVAEKQDPESAWVRMALAIQVGTLMQLRRYEDVEPLIRRQLTILKKTDGERSLTYALELMTLSALFNLRGEYAAAVAIDEQVLAIYDALAKSPNDPDLLAPLTRLVASYWATSQSAKAEKIADRLMTIAEKDGKALTLHTGLVNPALYAHLAGRDDLATPRFKRAITELTKQIARLEKSSASSPELILMYAALGDAYQFTGDLVSADKSYTKTVELGEKGGGTSAYATMLAYIKRRLGKSKEALALLDRSVAKLPKGIEHSLDQMRAELLVDLGEVKKAQALQETWRTHMEKQIGKDNPQYGFVQRGAAYFEMRVGRLAEAERLLSDSLETAERELQRMLTVGTEADHREYFERTKDVLDTATGFALDIAPKSLGATRLGLTTLLRRKGRILDAAATSMATIRAKLSPEDKQLLDELESARGKLAKLTVASASIPDAAKQIASLESDIQKLEIEISKKSAAYRAVVQSITLPGVQKLVPQGAQLIEIVNWKPFDPTKPVLPPGTAPPDRRYAAYVLSHSGDPALVDLGPAPAIDAAVTTFRKALSKPKGENVEELGRALYDLTIAKIAPRLGKDTDILIAPDGTLNLVPFAALSDERGEYLVKRYTFTYLTSGRDLFRVAIKARSKGGGVIFADPTFDAPDAQSSGPSKEQNRGARIPESRGARSIDLASVSWPQLPGTRQEAEYVTRVMKGLNLFRGKDATEGRIKQLHGPRIVHLATHGFFLKDKQPASDDTRSAAGVAKPGQENPLLRSGLVLAGANQLESGNDDGILTAMEASALDLWGTRLVVLSACQTGAGSVTNGDGVYGLRRALVIAGAEGLVMSLWQVDDLATRDLMTGFYERLAGGKPRSSALREMQLELLARPKYQHPYFWAAFVPTGSNTPLD